MSKISPLPVIGLDLSLRSTGFADSTGEFQLRTESLGIARLRCLTKQIVSRVVKQEAKPLVVLEGPAYAAKGRQHSIGELHGAVKVALAVGGSLLASVPPSTLKKFAGCKGNASKEQVLAAVEERTGKSWEGPAKSDKCDAFLLRQMGLAKLGVESEWSWELDNLEKVEWPKVLNHSSIPSSQQDHLLFHGGHQS